MFSKTESSIFVVSYVLRWFFLSTLVFYTGDETWDLANQLKRVLCCILERLSARLSIADKRLLEIMRLLRSGKLKTCTKFQ